jgi:small subunit ribosomal protein S20
MILPFIWICGVVTVANIKSAIKRARQNTKIKQQNASARSRYRTYIKHVLKAVEEGNQASARDAYNHAQPIIDSAVNKGIIHKNKAARIKSRLSRHIKAMAA